MKLPKFLKNTSFNDVEDIINEYISFHNNLWLKNAKKTEIAIYNKEPRVRTKKLIELPVINSITNNNLTYIFLGPFPQIPKYNVKLTNEIINTLRYNKSEYNDFLAYINNNYSILLQTEPRFVPYETIKDSNKSHFYFGLGNVIASNTNFVDKETVPNHYDLQKIKKKLKKIKFEKMKNDVFWFGEIIKTRDRYCNKLFSINKEHQKRLKEIQSNNRSLLIICEDRNFADYFCQDQN